MSILQKDFDVSVIPGTTGSQGTPGTPAVPGFWTIEETKGLTYDEYVKPTNTTIAESNKRFASHSELRLMWPNILTNCDMQKKILYTIRTTRTGGIPLYWLSSVQYIAVAQITYGDRLGTGLCVVTGPVETFTNPEYWGSAYSYHGELPGCP